jgi:hypothetical protein
MQVQIILALRDQGTAALRALALRRTRFALRRVLGLQPRAEVTLSDVSAADPGSGKQCEVRLATDGAGTVVARSLSSDWRSAVDRALARAVRRLMAACRRMWQSSDGRPALAWQRDSSRDRR